jgi:integrase
MKSQKALDDCNLRLASGNIGFTIEIKNNALALRGSLPPKDGIGDLKAQRIYLGYPPLAEGIKQAEKDALSIRVQLIEKRFNWIDWSAKLKKIEENPPDLTIAALTQRFEKDYFTRRARNCKSETTFQTEYRCIFRKLPPTHQLTEAVIMRAIADTVPETRTRKRCVMVCGALAKFAGLDIDLSQYAKGYSPAKVNLRELPTDETIELYWSLIPTIAWKNAYALMAVYGIRPHEVGRVNLANCEFPILQVPHETKTGFRLVRPLHPHWVEKFGISSTMEMPKISGYKNADIGNRVSHQFSRYAIAFPPYNLRHAYAVRCSIAYQMPTAIAAKMMGHSANVHQAVYLRHLSEESVDQVYAKKVEEFKV